MHFFADLNWCVVAVRLECALKETELSIGSIRKTIWAVRHRFGIALRGYRSPSGFFLKICAQGLIPDVRVSSSWPSIRRCTLSSRQDVYITDAAATVGPPWPDLVANTPRDFCESGESRAAKQPALDLQIPVHHSAGSQIRKLARSANQQNFWRICQRVNPSINNSSQPLFF